MRLRTIAASSAFLVAAGLATPNIAFADTSSATLYVNNATDSGCSDAAGLGTAASPFCTIQAAVDVAKPGDTVEVEPGEGQGYSGADITTSGTAGAPITITGDETDTYVNVGAVQGAVSAHIFTVTGASDIVIKNFYLGSSTSDAVLVDDSSDVTIDSLNIDIFGGSGGGIHVTGDSSHVTVSRDSVDVATGPGIAVDPGSSAAAGPGDVITTDQVFDSGGPGILLRSVPGADVTSNTVQNTCHTGIALTGTSTGASIENNVVEDVLTTAVPITPGFPCQAATGPAAGIEVDSTATAGTTENYDIVYPGNATPYLWSGTSYNSPAALTGAVGQGAADIEAEALGGSAGPGWSVPSEHSPAIDSADSDAPGELTTDISGAARVDDPLVADSGVGSSTVYDRGAFEFQDQVSLTKWLVISAGGTPQSQAPAGTPLTFQIAGSDPWGGQLTYVFSFGDGQTATNTTGTATHTYAAAGDYSIDIDFTSTKGGGSGEGTSFQVTPAAPLKAAFTAIQTSPLTVTVDTAPSTDPWEVYQYLFSWGDNSAGSSPAPGTTTATHTYPRAGTYPVTLTMTDSGGNNVVTTVPITVIGSSGTPCAQSAFPHCPGVPQSATAPKTAQSAFSALSAPTSSGALGSSASGFASAGLSGGFGAAGLGLVPFGSALWAQAGAPESGAFAGLTAAARPGGPFGCLANAGFVGLVGLPFGCVGTI